RVAGFIEPGLAGRLDRLLMAAQREQAVTGPPITANMVPPSAHLGCRPGMDRLSLSTPAVIEDIAFIEESYSCGGEGGGGRLIALQRQSGRWITIAAMGTWIS